jgi:hypothetical protein
VLLPLPWIVQRNHVPLNSGPMRTTDEPWPLATRRRAITRKCWLNLPRAPCFIDPPRSGSIGSVNTVRPAKPAAVQRCASHELVVAIELQLPLLM